MKCARRAARACVIKGRSPAASSAAIIRPRRRTVGPPNSRRSLGAEPARRATDPEVAPSVVELCDGVLGVMLVRRWLGQRPPRRVVQKSSHCRWHTPARRRRTGVSDDLGRRPLGTREHQPSVGSSDHRRRRERAAPHVALPAMRATTHVDGKLLCAVGSPRSASRLAPARSAVTSSTTSGRRLATMARPPRRRARRMTGSSGAGESDLVGVAPGP